MIFCHIRLEKSTSVSCFKHFSIFTPRFFVRVLVELEEVVNEQWEDRDGRKKMSKSNAKSLGSLRQKHRKYIKVIYLLLCPAKVHVVSDYKKR